MKRFSFLMVLFLFLITKGVAQETEKELFESRVEDKMYYEYLSTKIPEKFVEPFYAATKKNKSIGIEILGLGFHESEWKKFISNKPNENGSIDLGPLMLNSYNIADPEFMRKYGVNSNGYEYDTDIYYMTVCITFYKALRNEYGSFNALQVYNGGPRVMRSTCSVTLKNTVKTYANKVYKRINECSESWDEFKTENKNETIRLVKVEMEIERQTLAELNRLSIKNGKWPSSFDKDYDFNQLIALVPKEIEFVVEKEKIPSKYLPRFEARTYA